MNRFLLISATLFSLSFARPANAGNFGLDFSLAEPPVPSQVKVLPTPSNPRAEIELIYDNPPPRPKANTAALTTLQIPLGLKQLPIVELESLFVGGSDSLVAIAVGHAEGTRTITGGKTAAYGGHLDPGNGVWNLGSFSYQHGASSPGEADRRQLRRLRWQAEQIQQQAIQQSAALNLSETLNGIDLANQSPAAALEPPSYIDWLQEARRRGFQGRDAVVWARTRSFLNPRTGRWDAPGLGNSEPSIRRDQDRRFRAVERVVVDRLNHR